MWHGDDEGILWWRMWSDIKGLKMENENSKEGEGGRSEDDGHWKVQPRLEEDEAMA